AQAISFILIGRLNPTFDPWLLTGYMLVSGSVVIFMLGLWLEQDLAQISKLFSWKLGSIFLFSAVIASAVGHMIYNFALKNVGSAETTVLDNLNPLFALFGSAILLCESILKYHYIGLTLFKIGLLAGSDTL